MVSEITEENENDAPDFNTRDQKEKIRQIIQYQKSLIHSSSSSTSMSSSAASASAFSSSRNKTATLLSLMRTGSTSLRRLFDMERTSLANHFEEYSGSPLTKPVYLWGSDSDHESREDMWASISHSSDCFNTDGRYGLASDSEHHFKEWNSGIRVRQFKSQKHKLTRKKSFRKLPGFGFWRRRGKFRFRLKLRRLRVMICGRKF